MSSGHPKKTTQSISYREGYDLWASDYDGFRNPMISLVEWALDHHPEDFKNKNVIELGCGTGRHVTRILAGGAKHYTGVDGASGMLAIAQRQLKSSQVTWLEADISRAFQIPNQSQDCVLVSLVLEHFEDLEGVLRRASELLRPEGSIRILEIHSDLASRGTGAHFEKEEVEYHLPSFAHDEHELRKVLQGCGFGQISVRDWQANPELIAYQPKLAKHSGSRVLLDISAIAT